MSIVRKVRAVERMYDRLGEEIKTFREASGIHCVSGCGKCCTKADIEASPLEFLPLAFHWFLNHEAEAMLEKLQNERSSICTLYAPLSLTDTNKGSCSNYPYRGLICRLFGYGASRDKLGELKLVTCKLIKEQQAENYEQAVAMLKNGEYVPVFTNYYQKLMQIDFRMGNQILPINVAMMEALEVTLNYYAYRPFPRPKKAV